MTKVAPIKANNGIFANRASLLKIASASSEDLVQASKKQDFNIRDYAKKGVYSLTSARLEGTVLGEKGTSLKLLIHRFKNKAIFAIVKQGKVLGAKGYLAEQQGISSILDRLCQKGKIKEEELKYAKKQLGWA